MALRQKSSSSGSKRKQKQGKMELPAASSADKAQAKAARKAAKNATKKAGAQAPIKGKRKSVAASTKKQKTKTDRASKKEMAQIERAREDSARTAQRRVGDVRAAQRAERDARNRKRYLKYVLRIVAVVVAVVALVFGAIFLYRSDAFLIEKVKVSGATRLTDQEISQLAAVPDDSTLLRLDSASIIERLETHPWIQSASITRELPNAITINIVERTPAAVVRINEDSIWVISSDNIWLSAATEDDWANTHRIVDVSTAIEAPNAGNECSDEGVKNAVAIYDGVSDDLNYLIDSISAESAVKAQLNLVNGVIVAFGEATDIDLKEAALWALLQKYDGLISYINVRTPSRPTYRTMQPAESSDDEDYDESYDEEYDESADEEYTEEG